jgi:hypothetical protein
MSEPDFGKSLDSTNDAATKLFKTFKDLDSLITKIGKKFNSLGSGVSSNGTGNTGSTGGFNLGGHGANFGGSLDQIGNAVGKKFPIAGAIIQGAGGGLKVAGSVSNMMPDVNATMTRMSQGYNAAVMNGASGSNNEFRAGLQRSTLAMMRNGLTSAGSDVQVANIMASSGIAFNANFNSTYNQNVRETAGISKYLNIDNATAAQSMANLTSGATSSMLMRNLGIMTSDPMSGKMYSFKDIASQFESRISKGGKITAEGVMDSYHRGFLGVSLANSGFDETQQQMILQDLMSKAKTGKGIDWANTKEMDKLSADNPMLSQYKMNYSDTRQMQKGEGAYKTGVDAAVGGLTKLNEIAGDLAATFGSLKSGVETFTGHRVGAGIMNIGNDIMDTVTSIIDMIPGGSANSISMSSSSGGASISGVGRSYSGGGRSGGGGLKSSISVDAPSGSPASPGTGPTANAGTSSGIKKQDTNKVFRVMKPVAGGRIIADWNDKGDRWSGGYHKAVDWDVPEGTLVRAAHDGHVKRYDTPSTSEIGNHVKIWWTDDPKYATQYAHLKSISVANGAWVKKGDPIGESGQTGTNCDGPHLHFEVWHNGTRVNPHDYLDNSTAVTASTKTTSTSATASSASGSSSGGSGKTPLPISLTAQQQVSFDRGSVSGAGKVDYYGSGGGTSSTIAVDPSVGAAYSSSGSGKNYLSAAGSSGQTHPLAGGGAGSGSHSKPNVTINLTISKATDNEAKKFAEKVKDYLQEDRLISNMGRL